MKKLNSIITTAFIISPLIVMTACSNNAARYENLETGEKVNIIKDANTGEAIDSISKKPILFYVDLDTKDTIYGKTGVVVNNKIVKTVEGTYEMVKSDVENEIDELKAEGDVKIKVDGDETKIKTEDKKIKIDGDETKIKQD